MTSRSLVIGLMLMGCGGGDAGHGSPGEYMGHSRTECKTVQWDTDPGAADVTEDLLCCFYRAEPDGGACFDYWLCEMEPGEWEPPDPVFTGFECPG